MKSRITAFFPTHGVHNIGLVYLTHIVVLSWFSASSWIFYTEKYISLETILLIEVIAIIAGMLVEIPSGAIADLFGRKQSASAGFALKSIGSILFLLGAFHGVLFLLGRVVILAGMALVSGSLEAIAYDSLAEVDKEKFFDQIWGKATTLSIVFAVISIGSGGWFWAWHPVLPMSATAVTMGCGALLCFSMREPVMEEVSHASVRRFVTQTSRGFQILFSPMLRWLSISLIILGSGFGLSIYGALRTPLMESFTYDGETLGYGIAFALALAAPLLYVFGAIRRKIGDTFGVAFLLLGSAVVWLVAGTTSKSLLLGGVFLGGTAITRNLSKVWIATIINDRIKSQERATVLSTLTFINNAPYLSAVIFLSLAGKSHVKTVAIAVAVMMIVGLASYIWFQRSSEE